ncbi:MAG: TonB-dependent receptor [Acidobacteriota bacterium]
MRKAIWTILWKSLFTLIFLINVVPAWGQSSTTASITGTVIDPDGGVLGNVVISAKNINTKFTREAVSDEDGAFLLNELPPGPYELTVMAEGFAVQTARMVLELGRTVRLTFNMKIGQTTDTIEVTALSLFEDKTESSTNIDSGRIESLPINRRNFIDFTLITPRVTSDRIPPQGITQTSGLSFNGQSPRFNSFTIDGVDNNNSGSGSIRSNFSQDAVQEFQVVSDSYSAEFGRALGGVINIVTKSGSNDFHGSLFAFFRNDELSARNAFTNIDPPFEQGQFGATISGPIKQDKAFFFASFERLSVKQNNIITITDDTIASLRRQGFDVRNGPVPFSLGQTSFFGRVDFKLSPSDTLYLRYNGGFNYNGAIETFGGLIAETAGGLQKVDDNSFAVNNTYINTGLNLVNETRFLYSRGSQDLIPLAGGPQVRLVAPEGQITLGRATFLPQLERIADIIQIVNNVTLTRGRNQIKFGIDYADLRGKSSLPTFNAGFATFTPFNFSALTGIPGLPNLNGLEALDPTLRSPAQRSFLTLLAGLLPSMAPGFPAGLPLADLPLPQAYLQGFGNQILPVSGDFFAAFVQNDIRVRPNLLLKLGLRYDLNLFRFLPKNSGNIAPRIGISYRPGWLSKMNLRASYGLFFNAPLVGIPFATEFFQRGALKLAVIPFPFSILPYSQPGRSFPISNDIPSGVNFRPQLSQVLEFDPNLRAGYTQQASTGFDYLLGKNTAISLTYDFVRGIKLIANRNINPIVRPTGNPLTSALTGRVDPTRGNVNQYQSAFDSYYHAFTISLNQRFRDKFTFLVNYVFSKGIDNFIDIRTDLFETVNSLRPRDERGLSLQDVRNRFVFSGLWNIDYGKNPLLNGYQISTIITLNSGRPYNLLAGVDLNQNGDNPPGDRPLIGGVPIGRNTGITPGFANVDLRFTRSINVNERVRIQGIVEIFNAFNRVNISDVARIFPPDSQGRFNLPARDGDGRFIVTRDRFRGAFAPRQYQLGLRVNF